MPGQPYRACFFEKFILYLSQNVRFAWSKCTDSLAYFSIVYSNKGGEQKWQIKKDLISEFQ